MELTYEKSTLETIPSFYYGNRRLFHLQARGEEINARIHADEKAQTKIVENETVDPAVKDQVKKNSWADFTLRSSKDLVPFMEVVKMKYALISEDMSPAPKPLDPQNLVSF